MSYAAMREIINKRFGERYVVPIKDIMNFSRDKYSSRTKYFFKMGEDTLCGIIHDFDDDPEKLRKTMSEKRFSTPTLTRCETNLVCLETTSKTGAKRLAGNTAKKLDAPNKKPKILTDQILKEQNQVDLSKIKQEFAATKSKNMAKPPVILNRKNDKKMNSCDHRSTSTSRTSSTVSSVAGLPISNTGNSSDEINDGNAENPSSMNNQKSPVRTGFDLLKSNGDSVASRPSMQERNKKKPQNIPPSKDTRSSPHSSAILCGSSMDTPSNKFKISSFSESDARLHEMEKVIQEKNTIISRQQKTIEDMRKALQDKQDLLEDLTRTSIDLQKKSVNNFDELYKLVSDMKQANGNTASPDGSYKSIGYVDSRNFTVHVGRDFYIPNNKWNYACSMVCPQDFVHELARALIGEEALKKSTLTGKGTHRSGTGNIQTWDQVDPLKVEAIRDALKFFLGAHKFSKLSAADKSEHILSVQVYIRSLIADLKKDKSQSKKKNLSTKTKKTAKKGRELANESNQRDQESERSEDPDPNSDGRATGIDGEEIEEERERTEADQEVIVERSNAAISQDGEQTISKINGIDRIPRKSPSPDGGDKENHDELPVEELGKQIKENSSNEGAWEAYDYEDDRNSISSDDQTVLLSRSMNLQEPEESGTPVPSDLEDNED